MTTREIVVVSGKGGTGKTTVTASLVALLAGQGLFCDADVDAPNLELLLGPTPLRDDPFHGMPVALVDPDACVSGGLCARECRFSAVAMVEGKAVVDSDACEGCGLCVHRCPVRAIGLTDVVKGRLLESRTPYGPLFHGRLFPGAANSGKLVQQIKDNARSRAREETLPWIIVDGPPGIGCPALSAMSGADLVLIVTEASRSAQSDLRRLVETARPFRHPLAVVLNKAGLAPDEEDNLRRFCAETDLPLLGTIPFDRAIAAAQAEKIPPLERIREPLEAIFRNVVRLLDRNPERG
jgi:MinD superfamily P-loop ATPase